MLYELIYFISSKIEKKQKEILIDQINSFIAELGGKILDRKDLGEKQLAYPVKKEKVADNLVIYFELDAEQFKKLEQKLKSVNEILRWQIFKSKGLTVEEPRKKEELLETKPLEKKLEQKDILDI